MEALKVQVGYDAKHKVSSNVSKVNSKSNLCYSKELSNLFILGVTKFEDFLTPNLLLTTNRG